MLLQLINTYTNLTTDQVVIVFSATIALTFLVLVLLFTAVLHRLRKHEINDRMVHQLAYKKAVKMLELARAQSLKMYADSQKEVKKIVKQAYDFKDTSQEDLQQYVNTLSQKQTREFDTYLQKSLDEFKTTVTKGAKKSVVTLGEVSDKLVSTVSSGIEEMRDTLEKQTMESQKELGAKIKTEYSEVEAEIEQYKSKKLKDIDENITTIILEVASQVIGKSISIRDHEELILKLLDEAKSKGRILL